MNILQFNRSLNQREGKGWTIGSTTYDSDGNVTERTGINKFFYELGKGIENWWYGITGQTEKTTAYQAQMAREDSAYQIAAEDMAKAGLSKYGHITPASTGSYGDGVPKGLQYVAALMDLKAKDAGIRKTNAEADNIDANTEGQKNTNRTFDETHAAEMAEMAASTYYNNMRGHIAEIDGTFEAEKLTAQVEHLVNESSLTLAKTLYQLGENAWQDEEHRSTVGLRDSNISLNSAQKEYYRKLVSKVGQEIVNLVTQNNYVSEQTKKVIQDTVYQALQTEVLYYNFSYSQEHGLRTTDATSKVFGINFETADSFKEWFKNWGGILDWPSWNDMFGSK